MKLSRCVAAIMGGVLVGMPVVASAAAVVRSAAGADPASITGARDQFRLDLGGGNVAGANGSFGGVRREINWDGVPDSFSSPNTLPNDFFNVNSPRGAIFVPNDPGDSFQVSADDSNPTLTPVEFGEIDPTYPGIFQTFSAQRLFGTRGDTNLQVLFRVPGTNTLATVAGFGAVFTDVDLNATIEFFDSANISLGAFAAPAANNGLSFLGVSFNAGEQVAKVQIVSGNTVPNSGNLDGGTVDIVVMDDFIYGEPKAIPEPTTGILGALALATLSVARRQRARRG
ncbi:MAG: hypothetical protein H0T51_24975 [Pirellulales bacterium]|nr:hypothetical protein [Pirellulales bacterium]